MRLQLGKCSVSSSGSFEKLMYWLQAGVTGLVLASCGLGSAWASPADLGWKRFADASGTSVEYPSRLLSASDTAADVKGTVVTTDDRRARLQVYTLDNAEGETPSRYVARTLRRERQRLSYDRVTARFFAISAIDKGLILYRRCNFLQRTIHCVDIRYPANEKRAWDGIVTRTSRSLAPR